MKILRAHLGKGPPVYLPLKNSVPRDVVSLMRKLSSAISLIVVSGSSDGASSLLVSASGSLAEACVLTVASTARPTSMP